VRFKARNLSHQLRTTHDPKYRVCPRLSDEGLLAVEFPPTTSSIGRIDLLFGVVGRGTQHMLVA